MKAVIFGSTGLVGSCLLSLLEKDEAFESVLVFNRNPININHQKITEIIFQPNDVDSWSESVSGYVVFCCVGTTIAKAGNREKFRKVDFKLPVDVAKSAQANGVKVLICVSSVGADEKTSNFYLRTKGEMEKSVAEKFKGKLHFIRPSLLLGNRNENRIGEKIGQRLMPLFSPLLLGPMEKYKAIKAESVALAMKNLALSKTKNFPIEIQGSKLFEISKAKF